MSPKAFMLLFLIAGTECVAAESLTVSWTASQPQSQIQIETVYEAAKTKTCSCAHADPYTVEIKCTDPQGHQVKKTKHCWHKKTIEDGTKCQDVCEADYNVCTGKSSNCQ